jgi:hypothetical protein
LNGRNIGVVVHTRTNTENLNRAHPGTAHSHNVGIKDGFCGSFGIVVGNTTNKLGNVDTCGACCDAGGIIAVQASVGLYLGLGVGIGFFEIRKDTLPSLWW